MSNGQPRQEPCLLVTHSLSLLHTHSHSGFQSSTQRAPDHSLPSRTIPPALASFLQLVPGYGHLIFKAPQTQQVRNHSFACLPNSLCLLDPLF